MSGLVRHWPVAPFGAPWCGVRTNALLYARHPRFVTCRRCTRLLAKRRGMLERIPVEVAGDSPGKGEPR